VVHLVRGRERPLRGDGGDQHRRGIALLAGEYDHRAQRHGRFELVRNIPVMGHTGDDYASHGEILYRNCRVRRRTCSGREARASSSPGAAGPRPHSPLHALHRIAQRSLELMCAYAAKRDVGGGKTPGHQADRAGVDRREPRRNSRLPAHGPPRAWKIDTQGTYEAREEISLIKFPTTANVMLRVIDRAIQVHGGLGVSRRHHPQLLLRTERAPAFTTAPTRCTRWWWRSGCCAATRPRASDGPDRRRLLRRVPAPAGAGRWERLLGELFRENRGSIRVKKEKTAVRNLDKIFTAALALGLEKGFHAMSLARPLSRLGPFHGRAVFVFRLQG